MGERTSPTEIEEQRRLLRELDALGGGTRREAFRSFSGFPLIAWGLAWLNGYVALAVFTPTTGMLVCLSALGLACLLTWLPRRHAVQTGWEGRMRLAWLVLFAGSFALTSTASLRSFDALMLFLGVLWALAMALYSVAIGDRVQLATMLAVTAVGGFAPHQPWASPLVWFGIGGGGLLVVLGVVRELRLFSRGGDR